jgi:hypothetical protein
VAGHANYLSASGSKFWQENWESHIDMLEDEIEGRLHKTVWLQNGQTRWSVSRINQRLSFFFIAFWLGITLYVAVELNGRPLLNNYWALFLIAAIIAIGFALLICQKTRLPGTYPKEDGSHGQPFNPGGCWPWRASRPRTFIRRYAPDEFSESP